MPDIPVERIKQIKSFPSLVKFLRDDLDWPLGSDEIDELVFEYEPDELGIDPEIAVKIKEIKQLRPLAANQPWGIFYIGFEPKRLPVVVLRRVLQKLVIKKRQSSKSAHRNAWQLHDLLFISSYGEENQRAITFAHFSEDEESKLPTLRVIGWDSQDTPLHMDRCINELENLTFDEELSPDDWRQKWSKAFTLRHREVISTSKALANELAALATRIRQRVNKVLAVESEKGPIRQLYKAFQETLVHDLNEDDFADMYAQTITYGLFSTKKSRPAGLVAENLLDMIPKTNPFLKELLSTFLTVGGRKGKIDFDELGIDDVVQTLRDADMDAVLRDFEDRNPLEDPVIHFYEGFLKEYDAKKKVKRGVFYTPRPVVSFIVRSVDEILRKDFALEYGLADTTTWGEMARRNKDIKIPEGVSEHDPFVQILDPAAGTGTFLVAVIDIIKQTMIKKWENEGHMPLEFGKLWNEYVPKYLLPRLYGFELMMAPYAIAHMKIGLKLAEGPYPYRFGSDERARIYLTNTLEKSKDISGYFEQIAPALAHEAKASDKVKTTIPITVVIGNPPYSKISSNLTPEVRKIVDKYRYIDGEKIVEKGALQFEINLQDDYVKFVSSCENLLQKSSYGIMGLITNNGYLTTPTLRGLRWSLKKTFTQIAVVDLHGHLARGECDPQGNREENIFDIQQGVAIIIARSTLTKKNETIVNHCDLYGSRQLKYDWLLSNSYKKKLFNEVTCVEPFFLYQPQNLGLATEFAEMYVLQAIFKQNGAGIITARDALVVDYNKNNLKKRIDSFRNDRRKPDSIFSEYNFKPSKRFDLRESQKKLRNVTNLMSCIKPILHRPFDTRFVFYHNAVIWSMSRPTAIHMFTEKNLALIATRQVTRPKYEHAFVSRNMIEIKACSHDRNTQFFPLYVCHNIEQKNEKSFLKSDREANLKNEFLKIICDTLHVEFVLYKNNLHENSITPDVMFNYIYSILYSNSYRLRYFEFLKSQFPRIPITGNILLFKKLSKLGGNLVKLHLLESDTLNNHVTTFPVSGDKAVTKVGEKGKTLADVEDGKGKLFINKTQYFDGVPEEVWNFHIGGYQVCHKWLADRKKAGRKLSAEDVDHYHKIVVALNKTIKIMKQIDETINAHGGWPIK